MLTTSPSLLPILLPSLIALVSVVIGGLIAFLFNTRIERLRANVGFKFRQKELRYSKLYDKRLIASEGLSSKLTAVIDFAGAVVVPFENVPIVEGEIQEETLAKERARRMSAVIEAAQSLHWFHSQYALYWQHHSVTPLSCSKPSLPNKSSNTRSKYLTKCYL